MALLLGLVGIYGVVSYSVSQRNREIGVRLALAAALALTRLMKSLLFVVSSADPLTYFAAITGLVLAAALASYLPARRATRVDPVEALRAE